PAIRARPNSSAMGRSTFDCYLPCFFFQAEDGIRDFHVTGVQTCALPIWFTSSFHSGRLPELPMRYRFNGFGSGAEISSTHRRIYETPPPGTRNSSGSLES